MRENWEWIKEAVRDIGGLFLLILIAISNVVFGVNLAVWIGTGDIGSTLLWALLLMFYGERIYNRLTPARGLSKTLTLKEEADLARSYSRITANHDPLVSASAAQAANYLDYEYTSTMLSRELERDLNSGKSVELTKENNNG